jgi:hypothetical protein
MILKSLGTRKPKGKKNKQSSMDEGHLCLREINISFKTLHYLGTNNFKHKYMKLQCINNLN